MKKILFGILMLSALTAYALDFNGWGDSVLIAVDDGVAYTYLSDNVPSPGKYSGWTIYLEAEAEGSVTLQRARVGVTTAASYESVGITLAPGEQFTFPGKVTDIRFLDPSDDVSVAVFPWIR